jgi:endoglucanase
MNQTNKNAMTYTSNPSGFVIHRGVNLSHWLSQTDPGMPRETFIVRDDIKLIKRLGFDHVRLPVDEENLWHEDGSINETGFRDVMKCLEWCREFDLRTVIDLHILRSHHFNARNNEGTMTLWTDPEAQDRFINLWLNLSARLKHTPLDQVAYELLNEPVAPEHEQWNVLIARAISAVRKHEPDRVIIVGPNRWQQPFYFEHLRIPENDPNIILSVHTYHPYFVTHYRAPWSVAKLYTGPVNYPGHCITDADFEKYVDTSNKALVDRLEEERAREYFDKERLASFVQLAADKAAEWGLQLYCNEFGSLPTIPRDMRLRYYQDITDVFREKGIAFANWDYKGNFGIVSWDPNNPGQRKVDQELVDTLVR